MSRRAEAGTVVRTGGLRGWGARMKGASHGGGTRAGFTLLEVMLALSVAIGLLVVVLYYYQQATLLRDSTLRTTAGLAAVRLCMDRLATELRTASAQRYSFRGGPREVEFLHCDYPDSWLGAPGAGGGEEAKGFVWRRIRYAWSGGEVSGTPSGLVRTEVLAGTTVAPEPVEPEGAELQDTNEWWAAESVQETEAGIEVTSAFPVAGAAGLTIPEVMFLSLRYWDGAAWREDWAEAGPPRGVEVTLALEPLPVEAAGEVIPAEVFRRVMAIPAGLGTEPAGLPASEDGLGLGAGGGEVGP